MTQGNGASADAKLLELAKRIPSGCEWSTGTGTKQSHAQILASHIRRHSFYAVADTEEEALAAAIDQLEAYRTAAR